MKKILILIFLLIATQAYGAGMVVNPYVCTAPLSCATNTIAIDSNYVPWIDGSYGASYDSGNTGKHIGIGTGANASNVVKIGGTLTGHGSNYSTSILSILNSDNDGTMYGLYISPSFVDNGHTVTHWPLYVVGNANVTGLETVGSLTCTGSPCGRAFATFYVSTSGTNNSSCGLTSGSGSCATLSYLIGTRGLGTNGDTIEIAAGSYTDNTAMSIPIGVKIHGAGSSTTTITTSASQYIKLQTSVPSVNGSNEISGFNLTASTTNQDGIVSSGRNNQKIHDMIFTNWGENRGLTVMGKYGYDDSGGSFYKSSCGGSEASCTYCQGVGALHVLPLSTDWATGIEIYNNTFTNSKMQIGALKGALIHDNTITNDGGANSSGIGHTGFWFSGGEIYGNTINMNSLADTTIAMELWVFGEDLKIHDNVISGWTSFVGGDVGKGTTPYTLEVYDNTFYISKAMTGSVANLEVSAATSDLSDVNIHGNYFASSASDRGCTYALAIWGKRTLSNINVNYNVFGTQYYDGSIRRTITVEDNASGATITNIYIYNNVFDCGSNKSGGRVIRNNTSTLTNSYWKNNIFVNMYGDTGLTGTSAMTGHVGTNNDSYNLGAGGSFAATGGASWNTLANNITTNPTFVASGNKPSPYYHLQASSPGIDTGANVGLSTDYDGNDISQETIPDIGAFERISSLLGGTLTDTKFCTWNSSTSHVDCNSTGGGSPGGSDTQVQFNSGGTTFGGDSNFVWNNTTKNLSLLGTMLWPNTTSSSVGVVYKDTVSDANRFIHTFKATNTYGGNTFIGLPSGNFTMARVGNFQDASNLTGVGVNTLAGITSGRNNAAFGNESGGGLTTGSYNTLIGSHVNTTGPTGNNNTGLGAYTLYDCNNQSSGCDNNTALGAYALQTCLGCNNNIAVGGGAMAYNCGTVGNYNIAIGINALNTVCPSGGHNIAIGTLAGPTMTTGSYNIMIGDSADVASGTASYQLNIGDSIKGNLSTHVIDFPGSIRLLETGSTPTYYTKIQSGDLTGADITLTLPIATGTVMATKVASPGQYWSSECAETCTGGTCTVNFGTACTNGANTVFLTLNNGANSVTLAGGNAGARYLVYVRQPATGAAGTVTWTTVHWMGGNTAPTLSSTNGYVDIVTLGYSGVTSTFYGAFSAY